ncbi:MAG: 16S rRNA (cytidine(1402)-2'-O)-methyltransferase [Clostridia bacterium]|nr:16S rRNA (cytidine(1402)-2'-O)-methyltransferase [Clostridia bacterium]
MTTENKQPGVLYLVATPIGNLDDITYRAVKVLEEVDFIAAEDTRHSLKLLNHLGITKPMTSYFEHNIRQKGEYIIDRILKGETAALISDAGTPAISDPGEDLVRICHEKGVRVIPVPGAVAGINALICSGLSTSRFSFEGFLSVNKKSRQEHLNSVKQSPYTLIFYEAPHKLKRTLGDMLESFGNRKITIARELTKKYEQILPMTLEEAVKYYDETEPKGEYVLVIEGALPETVQDENALNSLDVLEHLEFYIKSGMDKKEAMKRVAQDRGVSRREIYAQTIKE